MYVSALLIHSFSNFSCILAFCPGFASDLGHLSLQGSDRFLSKGCDTYCEILSSQAVVFLNTEGKYILNKEAF